MTEFKIVAPVAAALILGAPAYAAAQSAPPQQSDLQMKSLVELDDDNETARWNGLSVDQLEDMDIVDANGDTIGDVEEVLADAAGNIVAVSAEVGGFLGIGDKEVVVAIDRLTMQGDRLMTSLTKEQLEALPRWDDD